MACLVLGLVLWSSLVVGRVGFEQIPVGFWLAMLIVAAVIARGSGLRPDQIAVSLYAGPIVASLWTAPRGDHDGLWILVVPLLAVAACLATLLGFAARRVHPPSGRVLDRLVERHLVVTVGVVAIGAVASGWLVVEKRANPYPELERLASTFPAPETFERQGVRHEGDPLCMGACRAAVELGFTTLEGPTDACRTVEELIPTWRGANPRRSDPIFSPAAHYYEVCSWRVDLGGSDGYVSVSDDPSGTVIHVLMLDPHGIRR